MNKGRNRVNESDREQHIRSEPVPAINAAPSYNVIRAACKLLDRRSADACESGLAG